MFIHIHENMIPLDILPLDLRLEYWLDGQSIHLIIFHSSNFLYCLYKHQFHLRLIHQYIQRRQTRHPHRSLLALLRIFLHLLHFNVFGHGSLISKSYLFIRLNILVKSLLLISKINNNNNKYFIKYLTI